LVVKVVNVVSDLIKRDNKRKLICIIKDFVKSPSPNPVFRCEVIVETIERMWEAGELSDRHRKFFSRAIQMELSIMLNDSVAGQYMDY